MKIATLANLRRFRELLWGELEQSINASATTPSVDDVEIVYVDTYDDLVGEEPNPDAIYVVIDEQQAYRCVEVVDGEGNISFSYERVIGYDDEGNIIVVGDFETLSDELQRYKQTRGYNVLQIDLTDASNPKEYGYSLYCVMRNKLSGSQTLRSDLVIYKRGWSRLLFSGRYLFDEWDKTELQEKLVAGENIHIASDGKTISADDTVYEAGQGIRFGEQNEIEHNLVGSGSVTITDNVDGTTTISGTNTEYSEGQGIQIDANNVIAHNLVAGANIQIDDNSTTGETTISATDTTYSEGQGVQIDANNVIAHNLVDGRLTEVVDEDDGTTHVDSSIPTVKDELLYSDDGSSLTTHQLLYRDGLVVDNVDDLELCKAGADTALSEVMSWHKFGGSEKDSWYEYETEKNNDATLPRFTLNGVVQDYIYNPTNPSQVTGFISPVEYSDYDVTLSMGIVQQKKDAGATDYIAFIAAVKYDADAPKYWGLSISAHNMNDGDNYNRSGASTYRHTVSVQGWIQNNELGITTSSVTLLSTADGNRIIDFVPGLSNNVQSYPASSMLIRVKRRGSIITAWFSDPYPTTDDDYAHKDLIHYDRPLVIDLEHYKVSYIDKNGVSESNDYSANTVAREIFDNIKVSARKGYEQRSNPGSIFRLCNRDELIIDVTPGENKVYAYNGLSWEVQSESPFDILEVGSRLAWNHITDKLFYNDGSEIYRVSAVGIEGEVSGVAGYRPGNNIQIVQQGGDTYIKAKDTTYTAGTGVTLTQVSADANNPQWRIDAGIPTFNNGSGIIVTTANNNVSLSADTAVLATKSDLSSKADKVSGATSGHLAGLDSSGNLTDSGKQSSDFASSSHSHSMSDITDYAAPTIPTRLSELTDDLGSSPVHSHSQYLTQHQDISGKQDSSDVSLNTTDKTVVGAINEVLDELRAIVHSYTIDFQEALETVHKTNIKGALKYTRIVTDNVTTLQLAVNGGSPSTLTLTNGVWTGSLSIADNDVLSFHIGRTTYGELATIDVQYEYDA